MVEYVVESCAGRVNPRGLRVPAFAGGGCGNPHCFASGAGLTRVEKFFERVTECWAKARELNQLKNRKTRGCTALEFFASIALRTVGLQQLLHYDVTTHSCETLAQTLAMWWASEYFPTLV